MTDLLSQFPELIGLSPIIMVLVVLAGLLVLLAAIFQWQRCPHDARCWVHMSLAFFLGLLAAMIYLAALGQQQLRDKQMHLAAASVKGVSANLELLLDSRQQSLMNFMQRYQTELVDLYEFPADEDLINQIGALIEQQMPGSYAFMLVDEQGNPMLSDALISDHFGGLGPQCVNGLQQVASHPLDPILTPLVHGFSEATYHIDVLIKMFPERAASPFLFVSFHLDDLIQQLRNAEVPGQELLLVRRDAPQQIELSSDGVFRSREYQDHLPDNIAARILFKQTLMQTQWQILVLSDADLLTDNLRNFVQRSVFLYSALMLLAAFLLRRLYLEQRARLQYELELLQRSDTLADSATRSLQQLHQREFELHQIFAASPFGLHQIFAASPFGLLQIDDSGRIEKANQQCQKIFGYSREEMLGSPVEMLLPADLRAKHIGLRQGYQKQPVTRPMGKGRHLQGRHKNGHSVWLDLGLSYFEVNDQVKFVVALADIGFIIETMSQLEKEREKALVTLNSIGDGVITTDAQGFVQSINPVAQKLTGFKSEEAQNRPIAEIFNLLEEDTRENQENPVSQCLLLNRVISIENNSVLVHRSGQDIPVENSAAPIHTHDGKLVGAVLVFHDVSQNRRYAREMEYQANHDALTNLYNRAYFIERLQANLSRQEHHPSANVLLFLDLDRFKLVNDDAGHQVGDRLLRELAGLIGSELRERDAFARLGGDEFAVLLEHCPEQRGYEIASRILSVVEKYRLYHLNKVYSVGVSIGLISYNDRQLREADTLLHQADQACIQAKEAGRNRISVYDPGQDHGDESTALVNQLNRALDENLMQLYQQQIVSSSMPETGLHCEILLRIQDQQNLQSPSQYLTTAERFGLSARVDSWVIENLFDWAEAHPEQCQRLAAISVNLSAQSLTNLSFQKHLTDRLKASANLKNKLILEITETAAISNLDKARVFVQQFRKLGCRFSLDDFGSGYSSYAYLKNLDVDFLKIDGAFVRDIETNPIDRVIVSSVNDVAHAVGLQTIAEYVENEVVAEDLRALGVDYLQGYGIAKPGPLDQLFD